MAVFKCKMCGGSLNINSNETVATCEYCGTQQTLPKFDDERKITLFTRANHLRFNCEFDKAAGVYESIVAEFPDEAEAYWGLLLCKYGIEYVDDADCKKIPTCHRTMPTSIMDDEDFSLACDYADTISKGIYREEAKAIDGIQKKILKIAATEEPYDIFICYKETDDNTGARTEDSSIAQDIYTELIKDGYKVFFSRVTLREVAGTEYEPYIYAALSSAKVMLAIGTKFEYYDAVWVKNEWSRFISMIGEDSSKILIPCYRNMDAYDMPKEFKNMQALDMGDVTFFASLTANINRLLPKEKATIKETVVVNNSAGSDIAPLLKRAFMFIEDRDWNSADEYCERVLDIDPENVQAYIIKLLVQTQSKNIEETKDCVKPFDNLACYKKIMQFGDSKIKTELTDCVKYIKERNKQELLENKYMDAKKKWDLYTTESKRLFDIFYGNNENQNVLKKIWDNLDVEEKLKETESSFINLAKDFEEISEYKDSAVLAKECIVQANEIKNSCIYSKAVKQAQKTNIDEINTAIELFESIIDYKDSNEQILNCKKQIEEIKLAKDKRQRMFKIVKISMAILASLLFVLLVYYNVNRTIIVPNKIYAEAVSLMEIGKYNEAIEVFESLDGYKDSLQQIKNCETAILDIKYNNAVALLDDGKLDDAYTTLLELDGYKDAAKKIAPLAYSRGINSFNEGKIFDAMGYFVKAKGYEDAENYLINWNASSIASGRIQSVGLKSDGTVVAAGKNKFGECNVSDWTDIVAISAGAWHTVGLKSDGTVVAVGDNDEKQCDVTDWTDIVAISAGDFHTVGLKSDGTVVASGDNICGQCDVSDWTDIVSISAGDEHTVGLKSDGTVIAVGSNYDDQCDVEDWRDIVAISVCDSYTVGLKSDGTVVIVGSAPHGRSYADNLNDVIAISAGGQKTLALKSNGMVDSSNRFEDEVEGWTDIVAISADTYHTVGLKSDGTVIASGSNIMGECDVDDWTDIKQPINYKK